MSEEKIKKTGGISVETEHIFPVIKKWLYSEKEIFIREIISNGCDAATKMSRLISLGEAKDTDASSLRIDVTLDSGERTISVADNGIGMTAEELDKYICSIALSGALDFIEKYEGKETEGAASGIIGHFGLGFYSAFMVSDTVDVITRSYTGTPTVKWICSDSGEYKVVESDGERERGTTVVMHINDEGAEYLNESTLRAAIEKYCAFMPIPIFFKAVKPAEDGKEKTDEKPEEEKPINDIHPLWQKNASDCTDEEYKEFYKKVFGDYRDPLFWIHINADYPLNFKGILYFPKLAHEYENLEGQVKLYYNQVFVADNIKEVIPEYLLLLRGVLDCPELPLNVSRSYLQSNGYVAKISAHIVKKVADRLTSMFSSEREKYEGLWGDIRTFVKYGCMCDRKFYDRVKDSLVFPLTDGKCATLAEYLEKRPENPAPEKKEEDGKENKAVPEKTVYYASDRRAQAQYISMYNEKGIDVMLFDSLIDAQYINLLEQNNTGVKFSRVDAAITDEHAKEGEKPADETLTKLFREASGNEKLSVMTRALENDKIPALLTVSEEERRFSDMMKLYSEAGKADAPGFEPQCAITLNSANAVIGSLANAPEDRKKLLAKQIWLLATLSQKGLSADELNAFLASSYELLGEVSK